MIDECLLRRAAAVNEAIAGEFTDRSGEPLENPAIARMCELGIEASAVVRVAADRARLILFHFRHGREPQDERELELDLRRLSGVERARLTALSVAWWDGALAALRARKLDEEGS